MTAFFVIILLCTGCSKRVPRTDTFVAQNLKVGTIAVTVDESAIGEDRSDVFDKIQGETALTNKLQETLTKANLIDPTSGVTLRVNVHSFRLRHGATRYFTGVFSGADHLHGNLTVARGSQTLLTQPIEAAGGNGNPFNISRDSRAEGLINGFCSKILNVLRNEPVAATSTTFAASQATSVVTKPASSQAFVAKETTDKVMGNCALEQVLTMKNSGFSDSQIRAACAKP